MPLQMRNVFSSHINTAGYDPETRELHITFTGPRGKYAVYKDVPQEVAETVLNSASVGEALHEHVRGAYEHEYL